MGHADQDPAASRPSDDMLVDAYLLPKIAGEAVVPRCGRSMVIVHDVDVCSDYPYELARKHASGSGAGDGGAGDSVWYFFSPRRYVAGKQRWRKVGPGPDGKGVWHSEGSAKKVKGSAAGTIQKFSYHEKTATAIVKPGWIMVEYAVPQEHGGGGTVLCKIYRSPRGRGSDMPLRTSSASCSGRKRKAEAVEHLEAPTTPSLPPPKRRAHEDEAAAMSFAQSQDSELPCDQAVPEYRTTTEQVPAAGEPQISQGAGDPVSQLARLREFMEADDDEMLVPLPQDLDQVGMETELLSGCEMAVPECQPYQTPQGAVDLIIEQQAQWLLQLTKADDDEKLVSLLPDFDPVAYLFGDDPPACLAEPEMAASACFQTPQQGDLPADGDEFSFTLEELMGSSEPGESSDGVRGVACPPMDDDYVVPLLEAHMPQLDPTVA